MHRPSTASSLAIVAAVIVTCLGCGKTEPRTFPVFGRVVFSDGTPLRGGIIEFACEEPKSIATGRIDSDGKFRLSTNREGDGAVAGTHSVIVLQGAMPVGVAPAETFAEHAHVDRKLHPKHGQRETTGLTATVKSSADNDIKVVVESASLAR